MAKRSNNKKNTAAEAVPENITQLVVEEGKKFVKEDFGKFSAIVAVMFSAGLWIVKSVWYTYMTGKFSVYRIDRCYINVDNDNIFLEIIQLAAIFIIWFLINYMYYKISVAEDKSKFSWKKKIKILFFWLTEMILSFVWVMFSINTDFFELLGEITIEKIIALLIVFFIFCLMINIYAIEFLIEEWGKKLKAKKSLNQACNSKKEKRIKDMVLPIIATIAVELIIVFFVAYYTEQNRCAYKLIMIQSENNEESDLIIEYGMDGNKYEIYPIVYENENCYIVSRLLNDNGKISIDYNYQRIIEKEGQETIYTQNIYDIQ